MSLIKPDAQNTLAAVCAELGNYERVRAVWVKQIRIDPDYQSARKNLAIVERMATDGASPVRLCRIVETPDSSR